MDMHGWIMDAAWDLGWMGSMKMQACCFSGPSADPMIETWRIVGAVASWNVGPAEPETLAACGNLSHRIQEHKRMSHHFLTVPVRNWIFPDLPNTVHTS